MAGRGFAPKGDKGFRVITASPVEQPKLPELWIEKDGELVEITWPARTEQWWRMWDESPLSAEFTTTDWSELLDTAVLHARFWRGETKLAAELRLRVAKFGATPEDRARLRITFAAAEEAEGRGKPSGPSSRARRGGLGGPAAATG